MTLIGATTENPYFEVNSALLSRTPRVRAARRSAGDNARAARPRAARGECGPARTVEEEALEFLAERSGGDARTALERARARLRDRGRGRARSTLAHAEDALQRRALLYDRKADRHYDTISAWIKATRGSDPDASLYYLAVMLEGGEDPRFIVRRMVILASEDIGNADPQALVGGHRGGRRGRARGAARVPVRARPGGDLLSLAPKSDAAKRAVFAARDYIRERGAAAAAARICAPSHPRATAATTIRTAPRPLIAPGAACPTRAIGQRFYEPDDAEQALRRPLREICCARGVELTRLRHGT